MPVAAGNLSGHTPAVYLPVAGAGIKKARDDLPGLWSTDRSGTIDQEGGGVKDNATFSLSHPLYTCGHRDQEKTQVPEGRLGDWKWALNCGGPLPLTVTSGLCKMKATCERRSVPGLRILSLASASWIT